MDPEKGPEVQVAQSHFFQKQEAPGQTMPNHGVAAASAAKPKNDSFSHFVDHPTLNMPAVLTWIITVLSIILTMFFWWMGRSLSDALAEKTSERDSIRQQISAQGNIEKTANDFKLSVNQLKSAYAAKFNISSFSTELNKKITNDVILTNLNIGADGALAISGTTSSYRSVADLMVALKSWDNLTGVELLSSAIKEDDGKTETVFSIVAKIDKSKQKSANSPTGLSVNTNNLLSGGE